jgi:hypothetical protein
MSRSLPYRSGCRALLAVLCLAGAAAAEPQAAIPASLQVPAGQPLVMAARAVGVQIYVCSADAHEPPQWQWKFKAPEAELFNAQGERVGSHYAGPTWEALDGSRVVGTVVARDDGPDPTAIAWLLLSAKMRAGNGRLDDVQSIQRVYTAGGKAPDTACTKEHDGELARTPYTATYLFYGSAPEPAATH